MKYPFVLTAAAIAALLIGYSGPAVSHPAASLGPSPWEWSQTAPLGGPPTWFSAAFTVGDKAYLCTGYEFPAALWQYDPGRDEWTRKADFPGKTRGAAVAFAVGDKGYIGLGYGNDVRFSDLWEYDPQTDRWTQKAPLPASVRDHAAAFVIGQKAYIAGGMTCKGNDCGDLKEVWEYEPRSDKWTKKADMPEKITAPACFVVNGKGYLGTGNVGGTISKAFWEYDPQTDRWTGKAAFPGPARFRAVGFSMDGKGYIGTGIEAVKETTAVVFKDIWEYDPLTGVWTRKPDFTGPARGAAVAFVLGPQIYIGTGVDSTRQLLRDFWRTGPASAGEQAATPPSVTVPFEMDHNRMFVEVEFVRPDGTVRNARAWMDTGNEVLILQEPLARELGYQLPAEPGAEWIPLPRAPGMRLNGWPLDSADVPAGVLPGPRVRPGLLVEAQLPASLFRLNHIVFDYPALRLTVARPGVLKPRGVPIPCRVNAETGLFLVEAVMDGETVALGVDNGSSYTWISDSLSKAWRKRHPDRPSAVGAVGAANFFGSDFETKGTLMRLPELRVGGSRARNVGTFGLDQALFDWYSKKSAGPVRGFIGANVLKNFRLEIDFPAQMTYWEAGPPAESFDLDIVGLTLRPEADGGYTIAGVAVKDGRAAVEGVSPGDKLIRVDSFDTAGASMGAVVDAMRGTPGTTRALVLERNGKRFVVKAKTMRFA